jgi:hypothetical protein
VVRDRDRRIRTGKWDDHERHRIRALLAVARARSSTT